MSTAVHAAQHEPSSASAARRRLSNVALTLIALNVAATVLAIILDLPSLFDPPPERAPIETDWIARGTAISAPLAPMALLAACALLVRRSDRWAMVGLIGVGLTSTMFLIGAVGEFTAEPTSEVPRAVLTASAIAWGTIALSLVALAVDAGRRRR